MEKVLKLTLTEDMVADIQMYGAEVDARTHVIDTMFDTHKNDIDDSLFTSVPFMTYQKGLADYRKKYNDAVMTLGNKLIPMVEKELGTTNVSFDWEIRDFSTLEVEIKIK